MSSLRRILRRVLEYSPQDGDLRGVANRYENRSFLGVFSLNRDSTVKTDRMKLSTGSIKTNSTYLVDPASGHMLVSKIKPCMSMHKPINGEAANGSLQQPLFT